MHPDLATIPEILEELRQGRMIVLMDDEDRENEGDLVCPAATVSAEAINFMATHGRGLICLSMTPERIDHLQLPPMAPQNTSRFGTAFHVSIEAREGVTTGISAADRAHTIRVACNPHSRPSDLAQPGHVFPLRAREGGVLVRAGQTEGSVDLCRLAGLEPAAVICEIMKDDGTMARLDDLVAFSKQHGLKVCTIQQLIEYRRRNERLIERAEESLLPTPFGEFRVYAYRSVVDHLTHLAFVIGDVAHTDEVLVRMHAECLLGDAFHSLRCECTGQLHGALKIIADAGCGILVYIREGNEAHKLVNKLSRYAQEDLDANGGEAAQAPAAVDPREYGTGAQILVDQGVRTMRLITNNPVKRAGLDGYDLKVTGTVPLEPMRLDAFIRADST